MPGFLRKMWHVRFILIHNGSDVRWKWCSFNFVKYSQLFHPACSIPWPGVTFFSFLFFTFLAGLTVLCFPSAVAQKPVIDLWCDRSKNRVCMREVKRLSSWSQRDWGMAFFRRSVRDGLTGALDHLRRIKSFGVLREQISDEMSLPVSVPHLHSSVDLNLRFPFLRLF